ncbi:MAG: hypothetical protein Q9193_006651, partial [Seirophora villosa]
MHFRNRTKTPARTGPAAKLDELPQEVLDQIFRYTPGKPLWSLLFQSKKMYHAVLPSLYRRLAFKVHSTLMWPYRANYTLLRMADKENPGLLHIRQLTFAPLDESTRPRQQHADYPDAVQVLAAIPKDSLRRFEWASWHQVPKEMLRLLWTRQRKLTHINFDPCEQGSDDLFKETGLDLRSFYEHATHLSIRDVWDGIIPDLATSILHLRSIKTLILDFYLLRFRLSVEPNEKLKRKYHDGVLLKELFPRPSYLASNLASAQPLPLKSLFLYAVDLTNCADHLIRALDTRALKLLNLFSCCGLDELFWKMSKIPFHARPRLLQLSLNHEQYQTMNVTSNDDHTDRTIKGVNEFLLSMTGTVQKLWIVVRGHLAPDKLVSPLASGIMNHGSSLLELIVDARVGCPPFDGGQRVGWFPQNLIEKMCAGMKKLELLYIPFPPVVAYKHRGYTDEFKDYMATVVQIPTLKTLNINNWPYPADTKIYNPAEPRHRDDPPYIDGPFDVRKSHGMTLEVYTHHLQHLMDWVVSLRSKVVCTHRPLEVVGFGMPETGHYVAGLKKYHDPLYFVRVPSRHPKEKIAMLARNFRQIMTSGREG